MAAFSSSDFTAQQAGRQTTAAPGLRSSVYEARFTVAVTTALALNDTLNFGALPTNAVIEDMFSIADQIDSNGAPTLTMSIGNQASSALFMAAQAHGRLADTRITMKQAAMGTVITALTNQLVGTVTAAGATKVAGNVSLLVYYKLPGNPVS